MVLLKLTWSVLKGWGLPSWLNSAWEPNSLASISGFMFARRSRMSCTEDMENLGRVSSSVLGK